MARIKGGSRRVEQSKLRRQGNPGAGWDLTFTITFAPSFTLKKRRTLCLYHIPWPAGERACNNEPGVLRVVGMLQAPKGNVRGFFALWAG